MGKTLVKLGPIPNAAPNEYLNGFKKFLNYRGKSLVETVDEPVWMPIKLDDYTLRGKGIAKYGFAIPTDEALAAIAQHGPIIELGAGTGYWAHMLANRFGVDIVALDKFPVEEGKNTYFKAGESLTWFDVQKGSQEDLARFPDRTLLLVWPPYDEPMAYDSLKAYKGDTLLYVGEGLGGCTGDDNFDSALEYDWTQVEYVQIPKWWGIHDFLQIYKRGRDVSLPVLTTCQCDEWATRPCVYCWDKGYKVNPKRQKELELKCLSSG